MKTFTQKLALCTLLLASVPLSGCLDWWPEFGIPAGEEPWGELNPAQYVFYSMHDSPLMEDQEEGMTYPDPNSVPVGKLPYPFAGNDQAAADSIDNPITPARENLEYGKTMYETTCVVCHGGQGKGQGYVVPPYPQPTDLTGSRARNLTDGQLYRVITHGQGRMWGYKNQLTRMERWAVVNYVRALQRSQYPEPRDLERVSE